MDLQVEAETISVELQVEAVRFSVELQVVQQRIFSGFDMVQLRVVVAAAALEGEYFQRTLIWLCGRQQQQMSWQWMQLRWVLIDFGCSWWWQQQRDGGDFQRTDIWLAAWQQHDGGIFSRL